LGEVPHLLAQIEAAIASMTADRAYDGDAVSLWKTPLEIRRIQIAFGGKHETLRFRERSISEPGSQNGVQASCQLFGRNRVESLSG